MKKALSLCLKYLSLFTVMGSIYYLIEIIWRGYSHGIHKQFTCRLRGKES